MIQRLLEVIGFLLPWIAAAFLGGMIVVKQEMISTMRNGYERSLSEASARASVYDLALTSLTDTKWEKEFTIRKAMRQYRDGAIDSKK